MCIVGVAIITSAVASAAAAIHWRGTTNLSVSALMVVWRAITNAERLNEDIMPAIGPADVGGLVAAGLVACIAAAVAGAPRRGAWIPGVAGAVIGLVTSVIIL